ncbi:MAG: hypothetical protein IPJ32_20815 [Sphingobacteriaceae bacterium]|nr:hypothetical protein [Sphingobacteriaceae bacterium]
MLFPYKYIEHNISFLQKWMDHLFMNVWCNADKEYDFDVLDGCPDLKKLVKAEYYKEDPNTKHKDYISGPIRNIYEEFRKIDKIERKKIKKWYKRTKNVNKTCQGQKLYKPLNLKTIAKISTNLEKLLKDFYGNLYDNILGLVACQKHNGNIIRSL